MQRSRKDQTSFANANGSYNFGDNPSNPYDTGFGFSNALLGVYNTFSQASAYINGHVPLLEHRAVRAGHLEDHARA